MNTIRWGIIGCGRFPDIGSHALDLIDFLLGPIVEAQGMGANRSGMFVFNTYIDDDRTTIHCEKGDLIYSVLGLTQPIVTRTKQGVESIAGDSPPAHVAQPLIQTVVDEFLGIGTCPSTGESALRTDWIANTI